MKNNPIPNLELKHSENVFIENIDEYSYNKDKNDLWGRFIDSFKRRPDDTDLKIDPNLSEVERAIIKTAQAPLARKLKTRHLQMIAIGGTIGTGLFVGSGSTLNSGGPAGMLIAYTMVASMIYCMCQSLGELTVTFPISASFLTYNTRFIDPSWGFTMAWNYAMGWLIILPLELVSASITIKYWNEDLNPVIFIAPFYILIVIINLFGPRGYGEAEVVFSLIKVVAIIGFLILGIVLVCGGGPVGGFIGGKYWNNPGAFSNGFKGVCSVFVTAAFSFAGTEMVGLAAAEAENPRKMLPKATKQVFWRLILFFIGSIILIGLLVPYNDSRLLNASSSVDITASPFVIAIEDAGIRGLPSVMNVVIMVAVLSVGNSSVYASSRTFAGLAAAGQAPKFFEYIDRKGRPIFGIIVQSLFGLLAFVSATGKQDAMFNWLLALSGISQLITWGSICLCHIRFRYALKAQNRDISEITFCSQTGIIGSYYGIFINALALIAQFWVALFPIGGSPNVSDFFQIYLSLPVILLFYFGHKIYQKNWILYIRSSEIDVDTGRRETDLDALKQELEMERLVLSEKPLYYRIWNYWC